MKILFDPFGKTPDGTNVTKCTLKNESGASVTLCNYGGTLINIMVPDKNGKLEDVVIGYDDLNGYLKGDSYQGALVGRHANRIADAKFTLNGKEYILAKNRFGLLNLHGGNVGFDKKVWDFSNVDITDDCVSVTLSCFSEDGEEGFPGNLTTDVIYSFSNDNELTIKYDAVSDQDTLINLTNHSYFNLTGNFKETVLDHKFTVNASSFTVVDKDAIPTGESRSVKGTPFDFTSPKILGKEIDSDYEQIVLGNGYDHNFELDKSENYKIDSDNKPVDKAAVVYEPKSGRIMEVFTDSPAVQLYTGNFMDGTDTGKNSLPMIRRSGFCLETQFNPDSPNQPNFHPCIFKEGEPFNFTTKFKFSVKK